MSRTTWVRERKSRMDDVFKDRVICALCEKPTPRYYCWAGKPEEYGNDPCPLRMPARWEIEN